MISFKIQSYTWYNFLNYNLKYLRMRQIVL